MADNRTELGRRPDQRPRLTGALTIIAAMTAAATLAGCSGTPADHLETGALASPQATEAKATTKPKIADDRSSASLAALKTKHLASPGDPAITLAYAAGLKGAGQVKQARDIVAATHATTANNIEITGALGLLELELGQPAKALKLLQVAATAPNADWRYHSGLGVAYAVQGKPSDAREQFQKALAKSPGNKTVLNNLAMSYMMDKKLDQAEGLLRQAKAGDAVPEAVAQNLELAARLRQPAMPAERRAATDIPPSNATRPASAN